MWNLLRLEHGGALGTILMGTACYLSPEGWGSQCPRGLAPIFRTPGYLGGCWEQVSLSRLDSGPVVDELLGSACMLFLLPVFLSLVLLSTCPGRRGSSWSSWGHGCPEWVRRHLSPSSQGTSVTGTALRPHADLVLCFGSDRFPVGWLPVVFSLSCTDENSPFCCEGQTMNAWLIYSVTWLY